MSEAALADRLRTSWPTLFSAEELATICTEFRVRPAYLLLGEEPMMQSDLIAADARGTFAAALQQHVAGVLGTRLEQDAEWVASRLGESEGLLHAVEAGLFDALSAHVQSEVADRQLATSSVREAIATRAAPVALPPSVPDDFFSVATAGLQDGSVIDPGASDERADPVPLPSLRVEELKPIEQVSAPDS